MTGAISLKDEVYQIADCAMNVLNTLAYGFAEKLYENALAIEFEMQNIGFTKQPALNVSYKDVNVRQYIPDFIVDDTVIVELKTVDKIGNNETGQILNYLKATGLEMGLILNFNHAKLDWKRVVLSS